MPTPFYHLSLAQEILDHPDLPMAIKEVLDKDRCSFFFGKTAPDVQTISELDRLSTHFFKLPLGEQAPAWETFIDQHPEYADPKDLTPAHGAFIAGYLCHLQADVFWIKKIFWPNFAEPKKDWKDLRGRLFYHNVLRAYLDERVIKILPKDISSCLDKAKPKNWLSFIGDPYLVDWRNLLSEQLHPNGTSRTAEVFGEQMGVKKEEIEKIIYSEENMETEVFRHIHPQDLVKYREDIISKNILLLSDYFKN